MTETPESGDAVSGPHTVQEAGGQPVVVCAIDHARYGEGGDRTPLYCPYCGGNARGDGHELEPGDRTVDCSFTPEATIRNCPGCGEPLDE